MNTFEALLSGASWNGEGVTGRPAFVTFSFDTAAPADASTVYSPGFAGSFQALSEAEQAIARQALKAWADASGVTFLEAPPGQGDIRFGIYDFDLGPASISGFAGFARYPAVFVESVYAVDLPLGGDIYIDRGAATFAVLIHEIGHALGLKHPHDDDPRLEPSIDDYAHTVMTYNPAGGPPTGLGSLDVLAVQHIYGPASTDGTQAASWSWDAAASRLTQLGGLNADTLIGVGGADIINGATGADRIFGRGGADSLDGGEGNDSLSGGDGVDTLIGGAGGDVLEAGGGGLDVLDGGAGDDRLIFSAGPGVADGGEGNDTLYVVGASGGVVMDYGSFTAGGGSYVNIEWFGLIGGLGNDTLLGGWRDDELYAGPGNDSISGGDDWDLITGDDGLDTVYGGAGDDVIEGGAGDDFLRGDTGDDWIEGGDGFDDTHGNLGDDTVLGGNGPDWVVGGQGSDVLFGDGDHDVVYGNLANDTLSGGVGNDWVRGGQGDDSIQAGAGDDFIAGDRGSDTIFGGAGADRFHSFGEAGIDRIEDFSAADGDRLNLLAGTTYTVTQSGADAVVSMGGGGMVVLVGVQVSSLTGDWLTVG
ncbi:M10 family metallopeptidase [Phenylobacterium sp. VNQ135]|uniref:M10 family metallopeptidase n=1 Tax=Phenylobacterium sp. VNQ135 TaxID=3400922 RepID=UPI003C0AFC95